MTPEEREARLTPAKYHGKEAIRRLREACSRVSATTSICFVCQVRHGLDECECGGRWHP